MDRAMSRCRELYVSAWNGGESTRGAGGERLMSTRCDMCGFDGPELKKIGHEKNAESFKKGVRLALLEAENKRLRELLTKLAKHRTNGDSYVFMSSMIELIQEARAALDGNCNSERIVKKE